MRLLTSLRERPTARAVAVFSGLNLLMVLLFTLLASSSAESARPWPLLQPGLALLQVALALGLYALVLWNVRPGERTSGELALLALVGLAFTALLSRYYFVLLPLAVVPVVARYWLRLTTTLLLTAALFVASLPLWALARPLSGLTVLTMLAITVVLNGYTLLSFEFALREARAREEVLALSDLAVQHAELAERARISRELHDTLGHHLTAQRFDLQVLDAQVPETARLALGRASDRNAEALADLRRAVKSLHPETLPGRLSSALEGLLFAWPSPARLDVRGSEPELPQGTKLAVYRAAQEALTNARKHAGGQPLTLTLEFTGPQVTLVASNPADGPLRQGGSGLEGLRQRATELGGTLSASADHGTYTLRFAVPLNAAVART